MKIRVTFYKEVHDGPLPWNSHMERVEFDYACNASKTYLENFDDAYVAAIAKGHNPQKNIRMTPIE